MRGGPSPVIVRRTALCPWPVRTLPGSTAWGRRAGRAAANVSRPAAARRWRQTRACWAASNRLARGGYAHAHPKPQVMPVAASADRQRRCFGNPPVLALVAAGTDTVASRRDAPQPTGSATLVAIAACGPQGMEAGRATWRCGATVSLQSFPGSMNPGREQITLGWRGGLRRPGPARSLGALRVWPAHRITPHVLSCARPQIPSKDLL